MIRFVKFRMPALVAMPVLALTLSCSREALQPLEPQPPAPQPPAPRPPTTGTIIVTVATSGAALDPDGYLVTIDRGSGKRVPINARETFPDVPASRHTVELLGLTPGCLTSDGPLRVIDLAVGATVEVHFTVACAPPTGSRKVYVGTDGMYDFFNSTHGKLTSSYVLHEDGAFALQFSSLRYGDFEYLGRYTRTDTLITFSWEGWSIAGEWGATGILRGDSLSVRYNLIMSLTDFIDGVYVRTPDTLGGRVPYE